MLNLQVIANKIVVPNLSPFDAINMIAINQLPEKSKGVGYYFYETTGGFYFRSWQSMITNQGEFARPYKQNFYYQPAKMGSDVAECDKRRIRSNRIRF